MSGAGYTSSKERSGSTAARQFNRISTKTGAPSFKGRHDVCLSDADVDRPRHYEDMIGGMTGSLVVRPDAQRRIWLHVSSTS